MEIPVDCLLHCMLVHALGIFEIIIDFHEELCRDCHIHFLCTVCIFYVLSALGI